MNVSKLEVSLATVVLQLNELIKMRQIKDSAPYVCDPTSDDNLTDSKLELTQLQYYLRSAINVFSTSSNTARQTLHGIKHCEPDTPQRRRICASELYKMNEKPFNQKCYHYSCLHEAGTATAENTSTKETTAVQKNCKFTLKESIQLWQD